MKVTLVTCLSADWQQGRTPDPYIPLGLLALGAVLEAIDVEVEIIDQTLVAQNNPYTDEFQFYELASQRIYESDADIVGFTTMCNSYPQTVELARFFHQLDPEATIIFGGPQATAVDVDTVEAFPWVDIIVRGEADKTFPELVSCLRDGEDWRHLNGLTWLDDDGVQRTPDAPLVFLDDLPIPAYHLYPIETNRSHFGHIPIDAGRGCPFECTFCSTNLFFKRRYRMKSAERLAEEVRYIQDKYDTHQIEFTHDMFTVSKKMVLHICDTLKQLDRPILWGCSARADCVTPALLDAMYDAGCRRLFYGLESGSPAMQRKMRKKLNPERVPPVVKYAHDLGIGVTASFIAAFPEETDSDLFETINMILDFVKMGVNVVQLHMLAPLVGSPLYWQYRDELDYDGHCSDVSTYLLTQNEVDLVERYPHIFSSFYHMPTHYLDREKAKALSASVYGFPLLLVHIRDQDPDLSQLYDRWLDWMYTNIDNSRQDYYNSIFGLDFGRFLSEEIQLGRYENVPYLQDYVNYTISKYSVGHHTITEKQLAHFYGYDVEAIHRDLLEYGELQHEPQPKPTPLMVVETETSVKTVRLSPALQRLIGLEYANGHHGAVSADFANDLTSMQQPVFSPALEVTL